MSFYGLSESLLIISLRIFIYSYSVLGTHIAYVAWTLFLTAPLLLADHRQEKSPLSFIILIFKIAVTVCISSESFFNVCQKEVHAWSQLFISHTGIFAYHILAMLCNAALCAVGQGLENRPFPCVN